MYSSWHSQLLFVFFCLFLNCSADPTTLEQGKKRKKDEKKKKKQRQILLKIDWIEAESNPALM